VVTIDIRPGDEVETGDRLAVIEAMKMETAINAEFSGTVRDVMVHPNVQVGAGSPMIVIDLRDSADEVPGTGRVDFSGLDTDPPPEHRQCIHRLEELRNALLGYDIELDSLVEAMRAVRVCSDAVDENARRELTDDILTLFVDLIALFRRQPPGVEDHPARRGPEDDLIEYLRKAELKEKGQPDQFIQMLDSVLAHYGVSTDDTGPELWSALYRTMQVQSRLDGLMPAIATLLEDRAQRQGEASGSLQKLIGRLIEETRNRYPAIHDLATDVRYRLFEAPFLADVRQAAYDDAERDLSTLRSPGSMDEERRAIDALIDCPQPLAPTLTRQLESASPTAAAALLEVMIRRYYRARRLGDLRASRDPSGPILEATYEHEGAHIRLVATAVRWRDLSDRIRALRPRLERPGTDDVVLDIYVVGVIEGSDVDTRAGLVTEILDDAVGDLAIRRVVVASTSSQTATGIGSVSHFTFRPRPDGGYFEERRYRDLHPMMGKRLELWRLDNFTTRRLPTLEDIYLFHGVAKDNPADERLFAIAEVRDLTQRVDPTDGTVRYPEVERVFNEVVASIRRVQAHRPPNKRLVWNRILLYVWPVLELSGEEVRRAIQHLASTARGIGLEKTVLLVRMPDEDGRPAHRVLEVTDPSGSELMLIERNASVQPIRTLTKHELRRLRLRQRGLLDPFDLILFLTTGAPGLPAGTFQEYDLDGDRLVAVQREPGSNQANIVVGVLTTPTDRYPEGMRRVIVVGDPGRGMGNVAEPECRRISAALDLAEELAIPLDWFAVSSGARISMDSGTENMDWVARVLRRLIEYTQAGHEVNVVVTGVNVGAQPYWNAEATMLMHTRGILIMTTNASMVLTGKEALDFSGGVSAEDNLGIGGYSRVMGPNGQAQYFAADVREACRILFDHHRFAYIAPGERSARRAKTTDPPDRDIGPAPHGGTFETVADVFSLETNPERKQPFEIRQIMAAAVDSDLPTLERWYGMLDAEVAVVWDAFLGGFPVTLLGMESKPLTRTGFIPADGPETWTAGTLFPRASKKVARAINAASGNRPLVVLANLSGFDGSPESMRRLQLEYGAEIGRAVVNFDGPIVFCVISRYHGGAFVVFSAALNDRLEVAAVEGARASVIGGAPAAAVVFAREVNRLTEADPRLEEARRLAADAPPGERSFLLAELDRVRAEVHADHMRAKAAEFDRIHDIERAREVGSVHRIISAASLRPYLIGAVERGLSQEPT
jgi:acetyl-CoA carboxylase carboxyltransferase component